MWGKVAIVTGGARGIGRAICLALAREGASIGVADIIEASETVASIVERGGRAVSVSTDVTRAEQVEALVERVGRELGGVQILVNNAGTVQRVGLEATTEELWDRDVNTIMRGTYLCTRAVYPLMIAQRYGRIVNVSSISGRIGGAVSRAEDSPEAMQGRSGPAYAAAKGGVLAFTKWVAKDGGRHNILANAVCPGPVSSEMTRGFDYNVGSQPIARMGEPEDIAEAVLFLASNAANFITGQALNVDGGLVMD
ncbi:MAG: SDR family oxidoreductase [Chloroflexi bacterium]|nr:SDR family oxidoreductase [Chloroflexota bacterium]